MKKYFNILRKFFLFPAGAFLIFAMPASTDYKLKDFGFGSGGAGNAASTDYSINGISGEQSNGQLSGASYKIGSGLVYTNQSNVPPAPTFTNPSNYYNKLKIVLDTGGNPSDTKFAIAISTDNFVSDTRYVQSDDTVGATLGIEDYQTYTNWGGAGGTLIIGLLPNTEYKVKVKAWQGKFTETGYGPVATASTIGPQMTFSVSPSSIDFGDLVISTVNSSPQNITISLETNGESGGMVYVSGSNAGLFSTNVNYTIDAVSGNLAALAQGFGAQGVSTSQTSGGPLTIASEYDHQGNDIVGITDQSIRVIFDTAGPIVGGSGEFLLKAKPSVVTPAASDYSETLTVVAAGKF